MLNVFHRYIRLRTIFTKLKMASNYIILNQKNEEEVDENAEQTENVADPLLLSKNLNRLMKT